MLWASNITSSCICSSGETKGFLLPEPSWSSAPLWVLALELSWVTCSSNWWVLWVHETLHLNETQNQSDHTGLQHGNPSRSTPLKGDHVSGSHDTETSIRWTIKQMFIQQQTGKKWKQKFYNKIKKRHLLSIWVIGCFHAELVHFLSVSRVSCLHRWPLTWL